VTAVTVPRGDHEGGHESDHEGGHGRAGKGDHGRDRTDRTGDHGRDHTYDGAATSSVSTHILDTGVGRPAGGVAVSLAARAGSGTDWVTLGGSTTGTDGRCTDLPALPTGTTQVRLGFGTEEYLGRGGQKVARPDAPTPGGGGAPFFPEVAVTFTVTPGEHFHIPLLLSPFGYSVYRGS
jgi:5-hydroxyisourate hydrolase